jgi:adenosylhomocysteinase
VTSIVRDPSLAPAGSRKIDWAATWAPVLGRVRARFLADGTVKRRRIGVILPLEPKTAYLAVMLAEAGAHVALACPAALVKDDVAAAVAERGVEVFARSDADHNDERTFFAEVLARGPEVVIDDRAELIRMAHSTHAQALRHLVGAAEQTTSGVRELRAMEREGALRVPCIASNDARSKYLFDNRYGSGQSVMQAVMDTTNLLMAGKIILVVGYGWVGKGIARRARGAGARVVIAEVDAFAALEAHHDGFDVMPVLEACRQADLVITATGTRGALGIDAIERLKDGAIIANAGGIDDEFNVPELADQALEVHEVRRNVVQYRLQEDQSVFVLGGGRVVNLSAAEGHPVEIMDLSFAVQALAVAHLLVHADELGPGLHPLPAEIDERIVRDKLDALDIHIDRLTPEQQAFLSGWEVPG